MASHEVQPVTAQQLIEGDLNLLTVSKATGVVLWVAAKLCFSALFRQNQPAFPLGDFYNRFGVVDVENFEGLIGCSLSVVVD
jgi:hypothetical protein